MFTVSSLKNSLVAAVFTFFSAIDPVLFAQSLAIHEDFDAGYPQGRVNWEGDVGNFEANSQGQLHLVAIGAGTSGTVTALNGFERMRWRVWAKLSFNTSASNYATIMLVNDTINHSSVRLQLGGADDRLRLLASLNQTDSNLLPGSNALLNQSVNALWLEISYLEGTWGLKFSLDGQIWETEGYANYQLPATKGQTGFLCTYTSSNSTKFYFDDFHFEPLWPDTLPPIIVGWEMNDSDALVLHFNEPVDIISIAKSSLTVGLVHPDSLEWLSGNALLASFNLNFPPCEYLTLKMQPWADTSGNWALDTNFMIYTCPVGYADVQINEVMPDPSPSFGLPEAEYIEIYNRRAFPTSLDNWSLSTSSSTLKLDGIVLDSGAYLLIVKELDSLNWGNGVIPFRMKSLSLPNGNGELVLRDNQNRIIHFFQYTPEHYSSSLKSEGGWSLERCDPDNNAEEANWLDSHSSSGGSPGIANSRRKDMPDNARPNLLHADVIDPWTIEVIFSESLDSFYIPKINHINLNGTTTASSVSLSIPDYRRMKIGFLESFNEGEVMNLICYDSVADLNGLRSHSPITAMVALAAMPEKGDILFNEILFDELSGQSEFIEIINASPKPIDLSQLFLSSFDTLTLQHDIICPLIESPHVIFPGELRYLSKKPELLQEYFKASPFPVGMKVEVLPIFPNSGACFSLLRADGCCIDSMCYNAEWHHKALLSTKGISLERISADLNGMDAMTWHSASTFNLGGSPGLPNSQSWKSEPVPGEFRLSPSIISPDNDGFEDYLVFEWLEMPPDCYLQLDVYNMDGRFVSTCFNGLSGESGLITWKGTDERGTPLPAGHYIIKLKVKQGKRERIEKWGIGLRYN